MDKETVKVSYPQEGVFSEMVKESIQKGISWLHNWYQNRFEMTQPNGDPLLSDEAKQQIRERLRDMRIYGGDQAVDDIQRGIANGELHPTPLGVESWKDDKYLENLRQHTQDVDHLAATWSNLEEKPIYLNEQHILTNQPNGYRSKEGQLIGVVGPVDEFAVHEATHVTDLDPHTDDRVGYITNTDILSSYRNQPREIYARLNNLRYRMQVDPTHVFTVEDVAALRKKCEADMRYFVEKCKEPNVDFQKLVSEPGRLYDDMLFDRFTDEQICRLLNEVAQQRDIKQLDEFHQESKQLDPVGERHFAAIQEQQPTWEQTATQVHSRGVRIS